MPRPSVIYYRHKRNTEKLTSFKNAERKETTERNYGYFSASKESQIYSIYSARRDIMDISDVKNRQTWSDINIPQILVPNYASNRKRQAIATVAPSRLTT